MNPYIIASFILYFAILLAIGLISHRKQTSSTDFIMGNRSLNYWLVSLSAHASDMSAWLFMAFPMSIFVLGMSRFWIAIGLFMGMFLNWQFVAPRLRTMTEKYDAYTLSSFFEKRFKDYSGIIRVLSAIMMIVFLTHYLAAGLIAMGNLFESLFGIDYTIGLSVSMFVVVIYTFFGGYVTVAWTDFFQGVFLLLMILLVPAVAYTHLSGGFDSIITVAQIKGISLSIWPDSSLTSILTIFSISLGWGLGYFGMPHIITKFMGIKDPKELNKSKWLGMSWMFVALTAAAFVGLIGIALFPDGLDKPEMVFVEMVKLLFHPFFAGIILCAVLAANMSTMDSQILVCASILSEDLYKHMFKKQASNKALLNVSRYGVIAVTLVALIMALQKSPSIMETVSYAWSGLGSAFGPLVLMSLYYTRANKFGAIAGIITGGVVVLIWPVVNPMIMRYDLMAMIPGFFLSALAIFVVSEITGETEEVAVI